MKAQNFLLSLPNWDGENHISDLANTIETDTKEWESILRNWMVDAIGCLVDKNYINETIIVLCGKQGSDKVRWIRNLHNDICETNVLRGWIMSNEFIICIDDYEEFTPYKLKLWLSKTHFIFRNPYAREEKLHYRTASLIATSNTQIEGGRRIKSINCKTINFKHNVNIRQAWAQALTIYKNA